MIAQLMALGVRNTQSTGSLKEKNKRKKRNLILNKIREPLFTVNSLRDLESEDFSRFFLRPLVLCVNISARILDSE